MKELTTVQWRVLTFFQSFKRQWGRYPQVEQVCVGCGIKTKSDAHEVMRQLTELKLLQLRIHRRNNSSTWAAQTITGATVGVKP